MKVFTLQRIIILLSAVLGITSCQDKWEDHVSGGDARRNLYEIVNGSAEYSKFASLLNQTPYADSLKASKNFTLILPNNSAIEEAATVIDFSDSSALKSFVGYHIINSVYPVNTGADTVRAKNLRRKYIDFVSGSFNNIVPIVKNQVASNGLFHVVESPLIPFKNIYDFVMNFTEASVQKAALSSFDTTKLVEGSLAIVRHGAFQNEVVRPMTSERQKHTYFLLKDDFFQDQYSILAPYYTTPYLATGTRPDSTTEFFTKMAMLKDFIVPGDFAENTMPDTLTSVSGFKFTVDKSKIISSHIVSNGRVYYVSSLPYKLKDQIRGFKVLGNTPRGFSQGDKNSNIYYRTKIDLNKRPYDDIEVYGHKVAEFFISYLNRGTNKARYKVYGRAISGLQGDPQTAEFTQTVRFFNAAANGSFTKSVTTSTGAIADKFTYVVTPLNHEEVYLGEYTQDSFGSLNLRLVGAPNTTDGQNTLMLEYLRFEPILQ